MFQTTRTGKVLFGLILAILNFCPCYDLHAQNVAKDVSGKKLVKIENSAGSATTLNNNPPPQMPNWPKALPSSSYFHWGATARLADLDNDGDFEIIDVHEDNKAFAWHFDGTPLSGWENGVQLTGRPSSIIATANVTGDHKKEIFIALQANIVDALKFDGTFLPGWPVYGSGYLYNIAISPTLYDIDGDGILEVIFASGSQIAIHRTDGTVYPGWPFVTNSSGEAGYGDISATAAVGDLQGNGTKPEIIVIANAGAVPEVRVYALNIDGTLLPGWPKIIPNETHSYSAPTLADLDNNGDLEILVTTYTPNDVSHIYVFNHDGTMVSGFPVEWGSPQTYSQAVVGDVDGNGDLEIFSGTHDNLSYFNFYGWHHDGQAIQNWPLHVILVDPSALLFDIDGDGNIEILTISVPGLDFYAFEFDGALVSGFPFTDPGNISELGSASVGDVDNDGDFELAYTNRGIDFQGAHINLWDFNTPIYSDKVEWGTMHHDNRNTNLYEQPVSGALQQNTTWWGRIKVRNTVTVPAGKTLNLQGGTTVHFAPGAVLNVSGQIKVTGTQYEPVVFDSNSNANFSSGSTVTINPGATVTVEGTLSIASGATITGGGGIVTSGSGKIFVTNSASALASNNSRKLARDSNGNYHLVFETNGEVCYEKLTSSGAITEFRRLSNGLTDGVKSHPSIYVRDNNIYVVWQKNTGSSHDITFHKSTDYGATWPTSNRKTLATNVGANPPLPVIASPTTNELLVVYRTATNLSYRTSSNYGNTWNTAAAVPSSGPYGNSPSFAVNTAYWGSPRTALVNATEGGVGTIFYRYYKNGDSTGWASLLKNLSIIVPGSYTGHKNPSLASWGNSGFGLHVAWEAANNHVIIHRKANSWVDWPNAYSVTYYEQQSLPSITGLASNTAELLFQLYGQNSIYKIYYDGGPYWNQAPVYVGSGINPSVSVISLGMTEAKYVWTAIASPSSVPPYEIKLSSETLNKTTSSLKVAYHRSIAIIDTTTQNWLEVRLDKLAVKTKTGEEFAIPFVEAKEDANTLTPANAFTNLASSPITLPANAESLFVRCQVNGQGLSSIKKRDTAINVEITFAPKNNATFKRPVINTSAEGLPATVRIIAVAASNLANKEINLRAQVSGIRQQIVAHRQSWPYF
jgi:hypothetical protein